MNDAKEVAAWLARYLEENRILRGSCGSATIALAAAFPELRRVPGFVVLEDGWRSEHWWCVAPDGTIVDPTAAQFHAAVAEYQEWKPGDEVRVGTCMNCGEGIYRTPRELAGDRETICSTECATALDEYYNGVCVEAGVRYER